MRSGLDEALEDGAALIEWPERLEGRLPPDRLGDRDRASTAMGGSGAPDARMAQRGRSRPLEFLIPRREIARIAFPAAGRGWPMPSARPLPGDASTRRYVSGWLLPGRGELDADGRSAARPESPPCDPAWSALEQRRRRRLERHRAAGRRQGFRLRRHRRPSALGGTVGARTCIACSTAASEPGGDRGLRRGRVRPPADRRRRGRAVALFRRHRRPGRPARRSPPPRCSRAPAASWPLQ